ncbi:MAG: hypothetical protein CMH56_08315 [Myxococcales bacterium]|nr:hypothetical protein [Myxococcales bacterium]
MSKIFRILPLILALAACNPEPPRQDAGAAQSIAPVADAGQTAPPVATTDAGDRENPVPTFDAGNITNPSESLDAGNGLVALADCHGVVGGEAYLDNCNRCVGGTTNRSPCEQDCNGDWGGAAFVDACDVCVGGTTGQMPCVPGSIDAGPVLAQAYLGFGAVTLNTVEITIKTNHDIYGMQFLVNGASLSGTPTGTDLIPNSWNLSIASNGTFLAFGFSDTDNVTAAEVNCSPNADPACEAVLILTLPVSSYAGDQVCLNAPVLSTNEGDAIGPIALGACKPVP